MYYNYIYVDLCRPVKIELDNICLLYEPFYIGKTSIKYSREHQHELNLKTKLGYKINYYFYKKLSKTNYTIIKINYTLQENISYNTETKLIEQIGSNYIDSIKNGPLTNICLEAIPPSHKGRTYEQIYGSERALEQRRNRSRLQKLRGGYGPKKHTTETKKKISDSIKETNKRISRAHSNETKLKMSKSAKERLKINNPHWKQWCVVDPNNKKHIINNGLRKFCNDNNISYSTLTSYYKNKPNIPPSRGKTKGWYILDN